MAAKLGLTARHTAMIGFVVIAAQMEQTVKGKNFDLGRDRMAQCLRVVGRYVGRDCDFSGTACLKSRKSRERKNIGSSVFTPELAIQESHFPAGCDEHVDRATQTH